MKRDVQLPLFLVLILALLALPAIPAYAAGGERSEVFELAAASCDGLGDGTWNGCRGNGCAVCQEKLTGYGCYFQNHPGCVLNTTCAGQFFDCDAACPPPTAADSCVCDGIGDGIWNGCRGNGCAVCQEKLAGYDCYFRNHPGCTLNTTCAGQFFSCDRACPAPVESDRCSPGVDADRDGIADSYEDQLLRRFAPVVRLHPTDENRPSSAEWYLQRTQMRFHHSDCSDCQILNKGQVTTANASLQSHLNKSGWPSCSHSGPLEYSDMRSSPSRFFLQIPNDSAEMTTRLGAPSTSWTCYAHVRRAPGSTQYDLQYWLFYPYNGDSSAGPGAHEGDWEHVTVRVSSDGSAVTSMYFSAHDNEGKWYSPSQLYYANGRPVAYSAWHTHASYPGPGTWTRGFPKPSDATSDGGPAWDCLNSVFNLGERGAPLNGKTWLNYSGRWGEIGAFGGSCLGLCFSGPWGPALQTYWPGD